MVVDAGAATYLDRVIAAVAAAAAEVSLGDTDAAAERVEAAGVTASEAGDVVARALVRATRQVLLEDGPTFDIDHLGPGWRRVVQSLGVGRLIVSDRPDRFSTGLIVGRFDPPHLGHSYMIEWAAARTDRLVVFVSSSTERDTAPGLRAAWLSELHPDVIVLEVQHGLRTDFDDDELWDKWMALFREHWPHDAGPHVVFSSDVYVVELAQRFKLVTSSWMPIERRSRSRRRRSGRTRPRTSTASRPTCACLGRSLLALIRPPDLGSSSQRLLSARREENLSLFCWIRGSSAGEAGWV